MGITRALDPVFCALSPFWALTNTMARGVLSNFSHRLGVPVVSIGNIVAGGVGKTEVAIALADKLLREGKRVVIASRGYGSSWEQKGGVAHDAATAQSLGFPDESIVALAKAPGVSVAVGADRLGTLKRYWEELLPDVVLLDDGFQHFKIARDLDVLVHDFSQPWPILRELPFMLKRARVRISFSEVPPYWKKVSKRYPWVRANYSLDGVMEHGKNAPLPARSLAFCGIGQPQRFASSLRGAGVELRGFRTFRDHATYGEQEARELVRWQKVNGGLPLLTTLKDFVKLKPLLESSGGIAGFEPGWVRVALRFTENESLLWNNVHDVLRESI